MGLLSALWGLLNLTLFVSLLFGIFTGFRAWKERFGFLGVILPLMLVVVMCQSQSTNQRLQHKGQIETFQTIVLQPNLSDTASFLPHYRMLDDMTTFDIRQSIYLTRLHQSDSVQINSNSYLIGFVSGVAWLPIDMRVNFQSKKQLHYYTLGTPEWQLLGVPVFKQRKQFEGYVAI